MENFPRVTESKIGPAESLIKDTPPNVRVPEEQKGTYSPLNGVAWSLPLFG